MDRTVTRRELLRLTGAAGVAALAAGSLSSSIMGYAGLPPNKGRIASNKYAIIVLVDGLRSDLFFEMLGANRLPHIKEHLADRGVVAECLSPLPSTTGPAHLPFLTGTLPGTNNITGIRWVDRENKICRDYCASLEAVMINSDYGRKAPTIFEILAGEETAAIYEIVNKGASYIKRPAMKEAWWASREEWQPFDTMAADLVVELYNKRSPRFTFVWMPGVDHLSHFEGPTSEEVRAAVLNVDDQIGKIVDVLKRRGIYDKALLGLVSDHGLRDTQQNWDLDDYLKELGLDVKVKLSTEGEWVGMGRYNAIVAVSGNAFAHVYLCDEGLSGRLSTHDWSWEPQKESQSPFFHGWRWGKETSYESIRRFPVDRKRKIDLVEELLNAEAVGILLVAEKWGKYLIFSSSGQSMIERDFAGYRYSVIHGDDPLRYADASGTAALMADGEFHSGDEWLKASWAGAYPDAMVQICQLFDSPRCGDIVVLAKPGWDLMDEGHIGSHGSMEREEMMVPMALAGPGIVPKKLEYARTVDIFPTCLRFFGLNPVPLDIDGQTLDIFA